MHIIRKTSILLLLLIAVLDAKEKISLQLLWKHQFEFAGFYMAKEKGFYADEGLELDIKEYDFGMDILKEVLSNRADIGIGRSSLVLQRLNGADIVLLDALYQSSPYVLLAKERADLKEVADFRTKKIMLSDDLASLAAISSMLRIEHLRESDYEVLPHSFNIDDLISEKTDIMTTYISNEPYHLIEKGIKYKVFDPKDYGFDFYADLLFTSQSYLQNNSENIKKFRKASLKGWRYAFENIDETAELILKKYNTQFKSKDALVYEAKILKGLAYKDGIDFGDIDEEKISNIANVYRLLGMTNNTNKELDGFIYQQEGIFDFLKPLFSLQTFLLFLVLVLLFGFLTLYKQYLLKKQNMILEQVVEDKTKELQKVNNSLELKVRERTMELQKQKDKIEHIATHDSLTALPNRLLFLERLKQSIERSRLNDTKTYVIFLDIDRFKEINDTYGHTVGDSLLQMISKKLSSCIRMEDILSRLGGDEFAVIVEGVEYFELLDTINKIIDTIQEKIDLEEIEIHITCSIGISTFPVDGELPLELLRHADTAMYKAKDKGKNQYQFYDKTMTELAIERSETERELRGALKKNQLETYFQPKVDASTNKVVGMEALVRWGHPDKGMIMPSEFILIAEETGLIIPLDQWTMKNAIIYLKEWQNEGLSPGKLSLNLSMRQLESQDFIKDIKNIIDEYEVDPSSLELEITESQIMKDSVSTIRILEEIRSIGISISVDDFGTGYSSLSYLKRLPVDKVKIDRSFVDDLPHDENDVAIVRSIIALATSLNLELIAEGVETKEQLDFLVQEGCSNIQGYYYSKPLSPQGYREFLLRYQ